MGILSLGIKAGIKAVIKKILNTEKGKKFMAWIKAKLNAFLSHKATKIAVYLASFAASAAIAVIGFFMGGGLGLAIAILAIVGAAFELLTLFLKKNAAQGE